MQNQLWGSEVSQKGNGSLSGGSFLLGPSPRLCSPCSCTNSGDSTGKGRRERMSCGLQEPRLSRLKQPCQCMCNHSLHGSLIALLFWMFSFCNFPFACLPTETDQSLGTCVCFLYFCFYFSSWSVTELYRHSGSNKKLSLEFLQKRASSCSQFGICWGFVVVGFTILSFFWTVGAKDSCCMGNEHCPHCKIPA